MAKPIIIYNSFSSEKLPLGKKVWAPLTKDINAIKNYLFVNNIASSIQLEKVFKELIDDPSNLTFFERKNVEVNSSKKI